MEHNWSDKIPYTDQPFLLQLQEDDFIFIRNCTDINRRPVLNDMTSGSSGSLLIPDSIDPNTQRKIRYTHSGTDPVPSPPPLTPDSNKPCPQDDNSGENKLDAKKPDPPTISLTYCHVTDGNISLNQNQNHSNAKSSFHSHGYPQGWMIVNGLTVVSMIGVFCLVWMSQVKLGAR